MKKQMWIGTFVLGLMTTAGSVMAADLSGLYGSASLGRSDIGIGASQVDGALASQGITSTSNADSHKNAYKFDLGYQINPNWGLEGSYVNLGKMNYNSTTTAPNADSLYGNVKLDGWTLQGVGTLPLQNGLSLYGKAGAIRSHLELSGGSPTGLTAVSTTSQDHTSLAYGAGLGYDITKNIGTNLEWNRYQHVGASGTTGQGNVDLYTVGLKYKF